jgi:type II secretory pathway pseudopilin PulG
MPRPALHAALRGAFTLVEMLVTTALTMLMILVLLSTLSSVAGNFQKVEARAGVFREARPALQMISSELQCAVSLDRVTPPKDPSTPAWPTVQTGLGGESSFGFLTHLPQAAQSPGDKSDICLVGYFLAPANHGKSLYRRLIPSNETFDRLAAGAPLFKEGDMNVKDSEPVADNVLGMKVAFLDATFKDIGANPARAAYIELSLRVIDDRTAENLRTAPSSATARLETNAARDFTLRWKLQ